jgi:flagellar protein FlbT
MTLRISLRDGEKLVVNGALLCAHGRVTIGIESKAAILRGRELMDAAEATSPAKRLYVACISAYIDRDRSEQHQERILAALTEVMATLDTPAAAAACAGFARKLALSDHYRALADCRALIEMEKAAALLASADA